MSDTHDAQLYTDSMSAIDLFLDKLGAYVDALITRDTATIQHTRPEVRAALATWAAVIVNRADSRTARQLVFVLSKIEEMESQIAELRQALALQTTMLREILDRLPPAEKEAP